MWPFGHSVAPEATWSPIREEERWVGKPWRRIALLTLRHFYQGEECDRSRDLTFHVGLRRLGFAVTLSLGKHTVLDYTDEPNQ